MRSLAALEMTEEETFGMTEEETLGLMLWKSLAG